MTDGPDIADVTLTVGELATLANITVRTLHHYDAVGLLTPSDRTQAGHRAYTEDDVARLQRILFYRELDLPLNRIGELLDGANDLDHLRRQHALLGERIARLQRIRDAVKTTMEASEMGINLTPAERLEVFGDDPAQYASETSERWGDTDAYRISQERTRRYSKADWLAVRAESAAIEADFAAALMDGLPVDAPETAAIAERHRLHIHERFYPLPHTAHCGLADLYLADPRFRRHYDGRAAGLAEYVAAAIRANADRAEAAGAE